MFKACIESKCDSEKKPKTQWLIRLEHNVHVNIDMFLLLTNFSSIKVCAVWTQF